jgi:hypothetical protein
MKKYVIFSSGGHIPYTRRYEIVPGCTSGQLEFEPNFISEHKELEEALRAFDQYKTVFEQVGKGFTSYISVTEFLLMEMTYDEDFDIWEPGEPQKISPIVINVCDKQSGDVMESFDNFYDAEKYITSLENDTNGKQCVLKY